MNGRCTADPLDHADDVCEFCGDEFCSTCLLHTRNGKGPLVCRECAVVNSGVKGSRPTKPRATKAQVQRARARLLEQADNRQQGGFRYFDEEEGWTEPAEATKAPKVETSESERSKPSGRRFRRRRGKDAAHGEAVDPVADEPVRSEPVTIEPASINDVLDDLPAPSATEASPPETPYSPETAFVPETTARAPEAIVHSEDPPLPMLPIEPTGANADGDAVAASFGPTPLADRIRQAEQSKSEPSPAPASLEVDPFSIDHDPFASVEPTPEPAPIHAVDTPIDPWSFPATAPTAEPEPSDFDWRGFDPAGRATEQMQPQDGDPFAPANTQIGVPLTQPASFTADQHRAVEHRAVEHRAVEHRAVTGPVPTPQSQYQPEPTTPAAATPQMARPASAQAGDQPSADLDANGNWVPPVLRGMAPVEERRAESLPRRRSSD